MDILLSQYSNNLFRLPVRVLSALVLSLENRLVLLNAKTPCDDVTVMRDVSWTLSLYFKINVYHLQENTVTVMVTVIGKANFTLLTFTELIFVRKPCHILLASKNS